MGRFGTGLLASTSRSREVPRALLNAQVTASAVRSMQGAKAAPPMILMNSRRSVRFPICALQPSQVDSHATRHAKPLSSICQAISLSEAVPAFSAGITPSRYSEPERRGVNSIDGIRMGCRALKGYERYGKNHTSSIHGAD